MPAAACSSSIRSTIGRARPCWPRRAALDVPINALHAKGFASIGCAPCTRAIEPGEPERNGRWWWEQDGRKECGLHLPRKRVA